MMYNYLAYYTKIERRICSKVIPNYGPYVNLEEGKKKCDQNLRCTGVLDTDCDVDDRGIYLCEGEFTIDDLDESCVYQKGINKTAKKISKTNDFT